MHFATDYDIATWQTRYNANTGLPNPGKAADNLDALREWADANSDGWAYWPKPARAAERAMRLIDGATYADLERMQRTDATDAETVAALRPIKAFLTRQGVGQATRRQILGDLA